MSGSVVFCPRCGESRTGRVCGNCGYDFIEGAKTPAITLSRGINPVSLLMIVIVVGVVLFLAFGLR